MGTGAHVLPRLVRAGEGGARASSWVLSGRCRDDRHRLNSGMDTLSWELSLGLSFPICTSGP